MALVTEDGSGLPTAESYISVSDAEAHLSAFGDTTFAAADTPTKEAALRKATAYIEQRFRARWRGTRLMRVQALSWPRYGAIVDGHYLESNVVPVGIANACADLALIALTEELNPALERSIVREKIGPMETEYDAYSPQAKRWPAITQALAPYLKSSGFNSALVRA